jgi:tetratricopeptide (TPR) repeat protein
VRVKHDRALEEAFTAVHDDPDRAIRLATAVIDAGDALPTDRIRAHWARGMALRERGELAVGADELFAARQDAAGLGDQVLAARIDTTLALIALYTGSVDGAMQILDQAEPHLRGADLARLETQRAMIWHRAGDLAAAERGYNAARRRFAGTDDLIGRARLLVNAGILHVQRGDLRTSEVRLAEAVEVAERAGQGALAAGARHNLGYARSRAGQLSAAIEDLTVAHQDFLRIGRADYAALVQADRAETLLRANLLAEAAAAGDEALAGVRRHGNDTDLADTALLAARCHLAAGRLPAARAAAEEAAALLRRQHRSASLILAQFALAEMEATEQPSAAAGDALWELAGPLERFGWTGEAMAARVRAGQLLLDAGELDRAAVILGGLRMVHERPAGERAAAYLARGLLEAARGDRRAARTALRLGLRVVAENQASLGGFEFRTFAAGHGEALVDLGVRLAVADRRPRELLDRVESTRRMLWLAPRATPPGDDVLAGLLAELRTVTEELQTAVSAGADQHELRHRRVELERRIRGHTRRSQAEGIAASVGVADATAALGEHALVEYAIVDGELYAVSVVDNRARLHELGSVKGLSDDVDACTFALHRLNRIQGSPASKDAARATLGELGRELAQRLVPERVRRSARPLVVVPAGALHGLAWGALPGLTGRAISVSPSLIGWAVARSTTHGPALAGAVLLAAGPGLEGAPAEIDAVARLYRRPIVLVGEHANAEETLAAMSHSRLAHLACHGAFRADNPLFSTISLAGGPMTVYDLERCRPMPPTVVLSACNVATSSVLRGGTLLGLASALMTFGASTVVAPLTPVNDARVVDVMVELHRALAQGRSPAEALAVASTRDDGSPDPTGTAFVAIGV